MNKVLVLLAVLVVLLLPVVAFSDVPKVSIGGSTENIGQLFTPYTRSLEQSSTLEKPLMFSGRVRGIGRFRAKLGTVRHFDVVPKDQKVVFLQGSVVSLTGINRVDVSFATLEKNGQYFMVRLFLGINGRKRRSPNRILELRLLIDDLQSSKVINVRKIISRRNRKHGKNCNLDKSSSHSGVQNPQSRNTQLRTAKLLLEADNEYQGLINTDLGQEMATIVNGVEAIYKRDLGLSFLPQINTAPQTYSSLIQLDDMYSFPIHAEMVQRAPSSDRVLHMLLTGKQPVGSTIAELAGAVPDLGTICKKPDLSVGFVIRWQDAYGGATTQDDIITMAHEIGHLFNAEHDDEKTSASSPGIMNSGTSEVSGAINTFSTYSKQQVASWVHDNGSCLGVAAVDATPLTPPLENDTKSDTEFPADHPDKDFDEVSTISFITASARRRRLQFKIHMSDGSKGVRQLVDIYCSHGSPAGEFEFYGSKRSNRRGLVRIRGIKGYYCKVVSGSVDSEAITVKGRKKRR